VLESSPFPGYRPGETLHRGVEPLLERLGVAGSLLDAGYLRHVGHWVDWAGREEFMRFGEDGAGPWRGFQAPRADFDGRLLEAAVERGAPVHLRGAAPPPIAEGGRGLRVPTPARPRRPPRPAPAPPPAARPPPPTPARRAPPPAAAPPPPAPPPPRGSPPPAGPPGASGGGPSPPRGVPPGRGPPAPPIAPRTIS